jgi:hypothetical protein
MKYHFILIMDSFIQWKRHNYILIEYYSIIMTFITITYILFLQLFCINVIALSVFINKLIDLSMILENVLWDRDLHKNKNKKTFISKNKWFTLLQPPWTRRWFTLHLPQCLLISMNKEVIHITPISMSTWRWFTLLPHLWTRRWFT